MRIKALLLPAASALLLACSPGEAPAPAVSMKTEPATDAGERLNELVESYFDEFLALNPLLGTFIGDDRFNDRLANNIGPKHLQASRALEAEYLERIGAIDPETLEGQHLLSYEIFRLDRRTALDGFEFPGELIPVDQQSSLPSFFAQLGSGQSVQPFVTVSDYENFLARIGDFTVWVDQAIANMRAGVEKGIVQPRIVVVKVIPQLEAQLVDSLEESLFYMPVENMPDNFAEADRERLTAAYTTAVGEQIIPAYRRLRDFMRDEYAPETRATVGISALPEGEDWYAYLVRVHTTTDLAPETIHQLGLDEVARIRAEMEQVMEEVGFEGTLAEFFEHVKTDDRFYFDEAEQLIDAYSDIKAKLEDELPKLFSRLPEAGFEIRPVEAFRAESAAGGSYQPATPDGSRAGVFYVNTFNLRAQPKFGMETLYLHEAEPGHHFQISLQQEVESLPRFRRFGGYTAYVEGWALYAESLGRELGLFQDPYQYYGRLSDEMLRAMRLVVDTGLHAQGWSRDKAIEYMLENSSIAESDVVSEVERYIANPGQALAYKLGQLRISELRAKAEAALGEDFDIREFHVQILEDGALPLEVLEAKVLRWIDT
ncbi:MAG: DUF885 domain-containing protein [Gammaproteobacteria bacterium]|nr:DUF885 domain-containing protein [Gammaproteobacteria bacterium]